jgi:hypothetical protein
MTEEAGGLGESGRKKLYIHIIIVRLGCGDGDGWLFRNAPLSSPGWMDGLDRNLIVGVAVKSWDVVL